jgi:hypothetical protein
MGIVEDMLVDIEAARLGVDNTEELGEDRIGQALAWVEKEGLEEWVRVVVACWCDYKIIASVQ